MTAILGWFLLLLVAPLMAANGGWLVYRVVSKAQTPRSFTRRQEAWLAVFCLALAWMEAMNGAVYVDALSKYAVPIAYLVELLACIIAFIAFWGFVNSILGILWWFLHPGYGAVGASITSLLRPY